MPYSLSCYTSSWKQVALDLTSKTSFFFFFKHLMFVTLVVTCQRLKLSVILMMKVPTYTIIIGVNMFYNFTLQFTGFTSKTEVVMSTYFFKPLGSSVLHWLRIRVTTLYYYRCSLCFILLSFLNHEILK